MLSGRARNAFSLNQEPQMMRERYGIGDRVHMEETPDGLLLRPVAGAEAPLRRNQDQGRSELRRAREAFLPRHQRVRRGSVSRANSVTAPQLSEYHTAT